jgi:hypothetical protein
MFSFTKWLDSGARVLRSLRSRRRTQLHLETLESRTLLSFTPAQIKQAYGFDKVVLGDGNGNTYAGDGGGQTIAIVDAYQNPNIAADLANFDATYGLSDPPSFQEVYAQGTPAKAPVRTWGLEIATDVEWAHALAPQANILLVDAQTSSRADLYGAVDVARNFPGVSVVSMSWGENEFDGETSYDSYFSTPSGHNGVAFVAAAGDQGGQLAYPALSPNVLSVGGTNLTLDGAGNYGSERAWSNGGGGVSLYQSRPAYQAGWQSNTNRAGPDVAYSADAFSVRDSYGYRTGWAAASGTSAGAPQWAAITAIVNQGLAGRGLNTADGSSQLVPALYSLSTAPNINANYFHDITTGSAGPNPATPGFDLATGLGTPAVNNLIPALVDSITLADNNNQNQDTATGASNGAASIGPTTAERSALRDSVKQNVMQNGKPGTLQHLGQATRTAPLTPLVEFLADMTSHVGSFTLPGTNQAVTSMATVTLVAGPQRTSSSGLTDGSLGTLSSPFYPLTPPSRVNSNPEFQDGDFMPRADDLDNLGGAGKGAATDTQRNTPRPAPLPATDDKATPAQTVVSEDACDACFASGNWFSAVSDQEVEALASVKALGQAANPAAAVAGLALLLGTSWRGRWEETETVRRRSPRLPNV